jgi:hypothetical protein
MQISILTLAVLILCAGIAGAVDIPSFTYESHVDRPGNFAMTDTANGYGYNTFQASSYATAGGVSEMTTVKPLPANPGSAPFEHSYQSVYMQFCKDGTIVDPAVKETTVSDWTVGTLSNAIIPVLDSTGNMQSSALSEGYDVGSFTVGAIAGFPVTNNNVLSGIIPDHQRYVFAQANMYTDDHFMTVGEDSAGTNGIDLTSYTKLETGSASMPELTPYLQIKSSDMRGYLVDTGAAYTGIPDWTIQNNAYVQQILPWTYRG